MDIQQLIDEGTQALEEDDLDRAEELARRILDARHSYGFELLARVHQAREDLPRAIEVLEEGVSKAPRAWPLWLLLGEYRSDHGQYDLALVAYDTALRLEGVDPDEVHLNAAIVHERAGRSEEALMRLHEVRGTSREIAMNAARIRADILLDLDRPEPAIAAAQSGLALADDETAGSDLAPLHAALARAAWTKNDRETALRHAWEALEHHPDETALWLVREMEGEYSDRARYYRISVLGHAPAGMFEERVPHVFFRKFDVVADDEEEALRFITRLEPPTMREGLRIDAVEVLQDAPDQPKGVYWVSGHVFAPEGNQ